MVPSNTLEQIETLRQRFEADMTRLVNNATPKIIEQLEELEVALEQLEMNGQSLTEFQPIIRRIAERVGLTQPSSSGLKRTPANPTGSRLSKKRSSEIVQVALTIIEEEGCINTPDLKERLLQECDDLKHNQLQSIFLRLKKDKRLKREIDKEYQGRGKKPIVYTLL